MITQLRVGLTTSRGCAVQGAALTEQKRSSAVTSLGQNVHSNQAKYAGARGDVGRNERKNESAESTLGHSAPDSLDTMVQQHRLASGSPRVYGIFFLMVHARLPCLETYV